MIPKPRWFRDYYTVGSPGMKTLSNGLEEIDPQIAQIYAD
jgi:hypothetical protein